MEPETGAKFLNRKQTLNFAHRYEFYAEALMSDKCKYGNRHNRITFLEWRVHFCFAHNVNIEA